MEAVIEQRLFKRDSFRKTALYYVNVITKTKYQCNTIDSSFNIFLNGKNNRRIIAFYAGVRTTAYVLGFPTDIAVTDGPLRDEIIVQHDNVRFIAFFKAAAFSKLEALDLIPTGGFDGLAKRQSCDANETA